MLLLCTVYRDIAVEKGLRVVLDRNKSHQDSNWQADSSEANRDQPLTHCEMRGLHEFSTNFNQEDLAAYSNESYNKEYVVFVNILEAVRFVSDTSGSVLVEYLAPDESIEYDRAVRIIVFSACKTIVRPVREIIQRSNYVANQAILLNAIETFA